MKIRFVILFLTVMFVALSLTNNGSSLAFQQKSTDVNAADRSGTTTLMRAVIGNKLAEVKDLIARGANINAQDNNGTTALIWAVTVNNLELVKTLLDSGADFNIKDKKNNLAVMYAHNVGFKEIANLLREAKDEFGRTSLIKEVAFDNKAEVLALLTYGFNINSIDANGFTPLMYASTAGNKQMVLLLLSNGASSSSSAHNGKTAASLAFDFDHTEIVDVLEQKTSKNKTKPAIAFTDSDATTKSNGGLSGAGTGAGNVGNSSTSSTGSDPSSPYRELVNRFFEEQKRGNSVTKFFCDEKLAESLFNVASFEIVNEKVTPAGVNFVVRVDSSTKGGSPVRVLWGVYTTFRGGIHCVAIMTQTKS